MKRKRTKEIKALNFLKTKTFRALISLAFAVLILEAFIFNLPFWLTSFKTPTPLLDGALKNVNYNALINMYTPMEKGGFIMFNNIDAPVSTIRLNPVFKRVKKYRFDIEYLDENSTITVSATLIKNYPRRNVFNLGSMGKVSSIKIIFHDDVGNIELQGGAINFPMPFYFCALRALAIWSLTSFIYLAKTRKWGSVMFRSGSKRQKKLNAAFTCVLLLYLFALMAASHDYGEANSFRKAVVSLFTHTDDQYNRYMVDAIMQSQLELPREISESLRSAERPYDSKYRGGAGVEFYWDHAYYNGKYYSYFGMAPVILLFLPFRLITGRYFPTNIAVFIFTVIAALALIGVWRQIVIRYVRRIPYLLYLSGALCLISCSQILRNLARAEFYELAATSALAFAALGIYFVLKSSTGKTLKITPLFFGSTCLAVAVGCRPNMALISFIAPVVVWKSVKTARRERSLRSLILTSIFVLAPYIVAAERLMRHNYERFGNPFEFGSSYQLTVANVQAYPLISPVSHLQRLAYGLFAYWFTPFGFKNSFPFAYLTTSNMEGYRGYIFNRDLIGVFILPISWFLAFFPTLWRRRSLRSAASLVSVLLAVGVVLQIMIISVAGLFGRYETDFLWLFILASLLCAALTYRLLSGYQNIAAAARSVFLGAALISSFLMIMVAVNGESNWFPERNPRLFAYLSDIFKIW
jgi:hypothetical protein